MALRTTVNRYTLADVLEGIKLASKEVRDKEIAEEIAQLSAWEIFNAKGFVSNINTICVSGLVNFALKSVSSVLPVRQWSTHMLAAGYVLFFEYTDEITQDREFRLEDPDIVESVTWRQRFRKPDAPIEVVIRYEHDEPIGYEPDGRDAESTETNAAPSYADVLAPNLNGYSGDMGKTETWVYRAHYFYDLRQNEDGEGFTAVPVLDERQYKLENEADTLAEDAVLTDLEFWPYRGVRWETGESLLEPIKSTILRIETALRNIGTENDTHSRRSIVYEGVDEVTKSKIESNEQGYTKTPSGSKTYYPDMHSEGMEPMFREYELLLEEVREISGTLRPKELHNASGPSRSFELFPNMALAQVLRDRVKLMMQVLEIDEELHIGPLVDFNPQEMMIQKKTFREMYDEGLITGEEYISRLRLLNYFPDTPADGSKLTVKKLAPKVNVRTGTGAGEGEEEAA